MSDYWGWAYLASEWIIRLVMLMYVPQRRSAAAARTWLLLIFLFPWPGLLLYAVIGRVYLPGWRIARQRLASHIVRDAQADSPYPRVDLAGHLADAERLAQRLGDFPALGGNRVELVIDYQGAIDGIVRDLDAAVDHAHVLCYILEDDPTGRRVAEALIRAHARGVRCRLMLDAVGSRRGLAVLGPRLTAAGVHVVRVLPPRLFRRGSARFDLRNHRKIVVVDGRVAWTGSQNLVDPEFVPGRPNVELMARVTGPVVGQFQAVFLEDWYFETGGRVHDAVLLPVNADTGTSPAQVLPSGPGYQRQNAQELIISLVHDARERVVIATPYFVPDEPFLHALRTAARQGVTVVLIVSETNNKLLTALAQRSYYDDLLAAGVHIREYRPGFLHAKHLTMDDGVALIGSINMDIRSFALNEEVGLLVYDTAVVSQMRTIEERYINESKVITREAWAARPPHARVAQNVARLADSLL